MTLQKKSDPESINVNGFACNHPEISDILKNRYTVDGVIL